MDPSFCVRSSPTAGFCFSYRLFLCGARKSEATCRYIGQSKVLLEWEKSIDTSNFPLPEAKKKKKAIEMVKGCSFLFAHFKILYKSYSLLASQYTLFAHFKILYKSYSLLACQYILFAHFKILYKSYSLLACQYYFSAVWF